MKSHRHPWAVTRIALVGFAFSSLVAVACGDQGNKIIVPDEASGGSEGGSGGMDGEGGMGGDEPAPCPHVGDPIIDSSGFPPCPNCTLGGAGCVPKALLPPENLASFDECDADSVCVPNLIIETRGNFIPATCESVLGSEGRCLNRCLPSVAAQADSLPQADCDPSDVCVPCFDPFTQEPTPACTQSCDPGPSDPPLEIQTCCSGDGVCLPTEEVGDKADDLGQDSCLQDDGERLCVPSVFLDPDFAPFTCIDKSIFGDEPGVCLPACLPAVQGLLQDLTLDQEGCASNELCAPCDNPVTGNPTGACDL